MVYFIGPEESIKYTTTITAILSEQRLYETTLGLYWGHDSNGHTARGEVKDF